MYCPASSLTWYAANLSSGHSSSRYHVLITVPLAHSPTLHSIRSPTFCPKGAHYHGHSVHSSSVASRAQGLTGGLDSQSAGLAPTQCIPCLERCRPSRKLARVLRASARRLSQPSPSLPRLRTSLHVCYRNRLTQPCPTTPARAELSHPKHLPLLSTKQTQQ